MSVPDVDKGHPRGIFLDHALGTPPVAAPCPRARIANATPLGVFSFGTTALLISLYNAGVRGIAHNNIIVGMGLFCGGLNQLLAGILEFSNGNTFGAAVFTSYGSFWMAYATVLIPASGISAAYAANESEYQSALGIFLVCWLLVTIFFLIVTLGKNIAFIAVFGFLALTFACLAAGQLVDSAASTKAGGIFGVITAFVGYYIGFAELLEAETHPLFRLPLGHIYLQD